MSELYIVNFDHPDDEHQQLPIKYQFNPEQLYGFIFMYLIYYDSIPELIIYKLSDNSLADIDKIYHRSGDIIKMRKIPDFNKDLVFNGDNWKSYVNQKFKIARGVTIEHEIEDDPYNKITKQYSAIISDSDDKNKIYTLVQFNDIDFIGGAIEAFNVIKNNTPIDIGNFNDHFLQVHRGTESMTVIL